MESWKKKFVCSSQRNMW
uniref:Uncharacterized protein n=1 Tax=Arundo donax TaxID=35708 RepID=A0A0A9CE80_ARUDO